MSKMEWLLKIVAKYVYHHNYGKSFQTTIKHPEATMATATLLFADEKQRSTSKAYTWLPVERPRMVAALKKPRMIEGGSGDLGPVAGFWLLFPRLKK
jgi:hypothetical protein